MPAYAHMATRQVLASAARAFAFLSDPVLLGRWSLGCFDTEASGLDGIHTGISLFDGGRGWFRVVPDDERLEVAYLVGAPDDLVHRISARIVPGERIGYPATTCLVSLMAWRPAEMDDTRWERLCVAHETEILLIKAQIEAQG